MAPRRSFIVFVGGASAALVQCTWLVDFVDQPATEDAGCDALGCDASLEDTSIGDSSVLADVADVHDAGPPDVAKLCFGKQDGWYCGLNGLNGPAPSKDDLVECRDASVSKLTLCDAGCLPYPNGVPDRCNECPGLKDGYYCGSQFPGAQPSNAHVLVLCTSGDGIVEQDCTPLMCAPGPGTAKCQ